MAADNKPCSLPTPGQGKPCIPVCNGILVLFGCRVEKYLLGPDIVKGTLAAITEEVLQIPFYKPFHFQSDNIIRSLIKKLLIIMRLINK